MLSSVSLYSIFNRMLLFQCWTFSKSACTVLISDVKFSIILLTATFLSIFQRNIKSRHAQELQMFLRWSYYNTVIVVLVYIILLVGRNRMHPRNVKPGFLLIFICIISLFMFTSWFQTAYTYWTLVYKKNYSTKHIRFIQNTT